jgi:hypothetical protein
VGRCVLAAAHVGNCQQVSSDLGGLVAAGSLRRSGFDPRPVRVGFVVVGKVALEYIFTSFAFLASLISFTSDKY